jgi:hypothetical protein
MNRCVLVLLLLSVVTQQALAQGQDDQARRWLEEINQDVWMPFMEGVKKDDESLYLRVRSTDYVRVDPTHRFILNYADYVDDTVKMMRRYREQGTSVTIDIRFEERITDGQSASEKGISRVLFAAKGAEARTYYGRFHTISRKEDGKWRVLTEYFPPSDDVGETQFLGAKALDDVAEFLCYMPYPEKKLRCDG